MPGALVLGEIEEDLIARLRARAARHGRSVEAEHKEILRQALLRDEGLSASDWSFEEQAARLREETKGTHQTPSEILQHEGRLER